MPIRWTDLAIRDFTGICDQSGIQFGEARSRRTALKINQSINSLTDFPRIGRLGRKPDTYELVIHGLPFIVIYRLTTDSIEVIRILHGAQRWP